MFMFKKQNPMEGWFWETTQHGGCLIDSNGVKRASYRVSNHRVAGGIVFRMASGSCFGGDSRIFYGTVEEVMRQAELACCR